MTVSTLCFAYISISSALQLYINIKTKLQHIYYKIGLLRRLQAQTLPNATPPIGNIYPFTKMAVTFEPVMQC